MHLALGGTRFHKREETAYNLCAVCVCVHVCVRAQTDVLWETVMEHHYWSHKHQAVRLYCKRWRANCQVCFHQDGAFHTRHTRRHNVYRSASLSVSLPLPMSFILTCLHIHTHTHTHTHTPVKPLPCLSPPFFPSINSVTPSSGPWHYRKTEQGKDGEGGGEGKRGRNTEEKKVLKL